MATAGTVTPCDIYAVVPNISKFNLEPQKKTKGSCLPNQMDDHFPQKISPPLWTWGLAPSCLSWTTTWRQPRNSWSRKKWQPVGKKPRRVCVHMPCMCILHISIKSIYILHIYIYIHMFVCVCVWCVPVSLLVSPVQLNFNSSLEIAFLSTCCIQPPTITEV